MRTDDFRRNRRSVGRVDKCHVLDLVGKAVGKMLTMCGQHCCPHIVNGLSMVLSMRSRHLSMLSTLFFIRNTLSFELEYIFHSYK